MIRVLLHSFIRFGKAYILEMIDESIINKAKNGDIQAFEEVFRDTNKGIYNFLLNLSSDRELSADLTQETFIRAFRSIKSLKNKDALISWIHRIALNLYRDEMKKSKPQIESMDKDDMEITDYSNDPEKITTESELQNIVKDAIQSLPEIHRAVVTMHHIEGMDIENIAKVLKTSNGTIMSRLARARESLRRKLAFYEG